MFKVPDWESDIPNPNINFIKNKNSKRPVPDNDNLDEQILKVKKQKLNEVYKQKDLEENLFSENNKKTNKNKKLKQKQQSKNSDSFNTRDNKISPIKKKLGAKLAKKNKTKSNFQNRKVELDDDVEVTSGNEEKLKLNKVDRKKEALKMLLEKNTRNSIKTKGDQLRDRMLQKLKAAQFRYLNEKLYTSSGNEAKEIFKTDPEAFQMYHTGYQQQVKKWPVNPLDLIVKKILKMPQNLVIADMGCGEAALSKRVPHIVKSFDLVAANPSVVACDMAHTPLQSASVDVAVYCLALMGTELTQYLVEANRVLKQGGQLLIAEVESRFDSVEAFAKEVERIGFKLKNIDKQHSVFFFLHFVKIRDPPVKKAKLPTLTLKPCLYKKR